MKGFLLFFLSVLFVGGIAFFQIPKKEDFVFNIHSTAIPSKKLLHQLDIPMPENIPSAHSGTLAILDNSRLLSAYFAGSKEGAKDVAIYANILIDKNNPESATWQEPFKILDRKILSKDAKEYISKIGNPVLYTINNTIHLFVVGVSIGGWATSKIYHYTARTDSEKITFHFQKALHLSPLLNISNLVRTQPIEITLHNNQQGFILPIYHEIANKYALNLIMDSQGKILQISKPNNAQGLLQPSLTALDSTHCLLAYRAHKKANSILYTQACNNQLKYSNLIKTNLENKDNSLNLFTINEQTFLLYNTAKQNSPRANLTLAKMKNYETFEKLFDLDTTYTINGEVSYPTTLIDHKNGIIHITYTVDRKFIRYITLNIKFLEDAL
ncbi:sialidase family protein [Helicobacter anatolicus]|uniref:sialidase family protein n=1 Tax=Helicobacter anatolicus TaxID=2905874 RepID=UPI001E3C416D|nr:sialidase family protein [Helicobacter anatolicus]